MMYRRKAPQTMDGKRLQPFRRASGTSGRGNWRPRTLRLCHLALT